MQSADISPLIREKINDVVSDKHLQKFIYEILSVEKTTRGEKVKIKDYESVLAEYVRMD